MNFVLNKIILVNCRARLGLPAYLVGHSDAQPCVGGETFGGLCKRERFRETIIVAYYTTTRGKSRKFV